MSPPRAPTQGPPTLMPAPRTPGGRVGASAYSAEPEPRPEQFGLTHEAVDAHRSRGSSVFSKVVAFFCCLLLLTGLRVAGFTGLLAAVLLSWATFFGLHMVWTTIADRRLSRRPDHGAFERYELAVQSYRKSLRTEVAWWRSLDGHTFERELAALLRRSGYSVSHVGAPGDQGVDLLVKHATQSGKTTVVIVQAKAYSSPVGVGAVRDLYGALLHHRADEAWLVTTMGFTGPAREFAAQKPIALVTVEELLSGAFVGARRG